MKYVILLLITCLCLCKPVASFSQQRNIKALTHEKKHKVAHRMVQDQSYYGAIDHLLELAKDHPTNREYINKLAEAYFLSRDYKNAEIWFEKTLKLDGKVVTFALFRYAECLKYNAKYEEAKIQYEKFFKSKYVEKKGEFYKLYAKNEIESCNYAIKNRTTFSPLDILHLGDHVNSAYTEFSPYLVNDSTLIFASLQSDSVISIIPGEAHTFHVKLMESIWSENQWNAPSAMPTVNSLYESNANGVYSIDHSKFYFTRCIPDKNNKMVCNIWMSKVVNAEFEKPKKISGGVNAKGSSTTQPNISSIKIGKSNFEVLIFSSNRKGTRGGMDLWYSIINTDGTYKKPVNLGKTINTIRDEITPHYDSKAGVLYFSSNYHFGFGGYDIFKSSGMLTKLAKPENIGQPLNSRVDDTYYFLNQKNNEGFFVSNRPEGYHLTSETCCDDIYSFELQNLFILKVKAFEKNKPTYSDKIKLMVLSADSLIGSDIFNNAKLAASDSSVSDSLTLLNKEKLRAYIKEKTINFDTLGLNKIIDQSFYNELEDNRNLFNLKKGRDYIIVAYNDNDTALFAFSTDEKEQVMDKISDYDTVRADYTDFHTDNIDLIKVTLYLLPDSVLLAVKTVEPEDEKTFTITKVIEDIKTEKRIGLKVILTYASDDEQFIKDHSGSLDSLVTLMKEYEDIKISISAHTDNKGSDEYNMTLSKRRARDVENYLISHGIDRKRMSGKGFGEKTPLVPNNNPDGSDNPEGRRINRRAEIEIIE